MNKPIFTISLDFELHWGRFDKILAIGNEQYYLNARKAIPEILGLFDRFGIEATWATVGMLFAENLEEWKSYCPSEQPTYTDSRFSPYEWLRQNKVQPACLFAPDLIRKILGVGGQEIGSHTFSHYYTLAEGQTENQFRQDLQAASRIAQDKFDLKLVSLVFPRNQMNTGYLAISREEGFSAVRSNPIDWYWKDTARETLFKKVFRSGDALFPIGQASFYPISGLHAQKNLPLLLPASRFLKPHVSNFPLLNRLKLNRVKQEMTNAAQRSEIYHLWWHPHNHGGNLSESLNELTEILIHFSQLREEFQMVSKNMQSLQNMVAAEN